MDITLTEHVTFTFRAFLSLPVAFHIVFIAIFAGLAGSFLNVCIWRIPRGESIVLPRSRCTACGHVLEVPDLFPILSYLVLRGRCRHCGAPVSPRYVVVEAINVALWLAAFAVLGLSLAFVAAGIGLSAALGTVGVVLMKRQIAPGAARGARAAASSRDGFSFISVLITCLILAVSIGPFLENTRTSFVGASKNQEYVKAYALAAEKIEELRNIPAVDLISDRKVYIETERLTDNIFADEFFGEFAKMREDPAFFAERFGDVYTERNKLPDTVMERFRRAFKRYHGFDYQLYPAGYEGLRRITVIEDLSGGRPKKERKGRERKAARAVESTDTVIKRATVTVEINSQITKRRKVVMQALFTDR
jgi:hypothetical protein